MSEGEGYTIIYWSDIKAVGIIIYNDPKMPDPDYAWSQISAVLMEFITDGTESIVLEHSPRGYAPISSYIEGWRVALREQGYEVTR